MFPSTTVDKRTETDEEDPTQVIDEVMPASDAGKGRPVNTRPDDGKLVPGDAQINTDDLCTQVFAAADRVADSNIDADDGTENPADFPEESPTQVFDELSEDLEPLTTKGKKAAKGGGRAKMGRRKIAEENQDSLETQVFDSFVPPAPPSRMTSPLQSDRVVDGRMDKSEKEAVATGGRRKRGRMSLKTSHRESADLTEVNKATTITSVSDGNPCSTDDLETQVFEAGGISTVPFTSICLDNVATQIFDAVPSNPDPPEISSVAGEHLAFPSGTELNLKSNADAEEAATQVFDDIDPIVNKRNAVSARSSKRKSETADTGKKTSSRAAGRQTKKSAGRRQTDSLAVADVATDEMDEVATQVFDAEPDAKPSKSRKNLRPGPCHPVADGNDTDAGKLQKSRGKPGRGSAAVAEPVEDLSTEREDVGTQASAREQTPKSRRLSSRANKGKHPAKEASLSTVPEVADADKPKPVRSQRKGSKQTSPSVSDDNSSRPPSTIQPLSRDITGIGDSKSSSSATSEDADAGKPKVARSQVKRARQANLSAPGNTSDSPVSVEVLYRKVSTEGSAKLEDRQRRNKKETQPVEMAALAGASAESHDRGIGLITGGMDDDEVLTDVPATAGAAAGKTPGKQDRRKTKKLYTAKGRYVSITDQKHCLLSN